MTSRLVGRLDQRIVVISHAPPLAVAACATSPLPDSMYAIRHIRGKGRGIVATERIPAGVSIVTCPVVVYDDTDAGRIAKTRLGDYNFRFGETERRQRACIVLGAISLCNHAELPNAALSCDEAEQTMTLVSLRIILPGEEICLRYRRPLWFTPAA